MIKNKIRVLIYALSAAVVLAACDNDRKLTADTVSINGETVLNVPSGGGEYSLEFTVSGEWTVTSSETWCTVTPAAGNEREAVVTLAVEENTLDAERTALVVVTAGTASDTLQVIQQPIEAQEGLFKMFSMELTGKFLRVPVVEYSDAESATLDWGDGETLDYTTGLSHTYMYDGTYTVSVTVRGESAKIRSVKLEDLEGVNIVDLSQL